MLRIQTNSTLDEDSKKTLAADASRAVADMLDKPERYVMVSIEENPAMLFGGSEDPLAYLELKSIGLPAERTTDFSAALSALLAGKLGLPPDRIYIEFADAARNMWGWKGGTF